MLFNIQNYNIFVISDKYADIVDKYKTSNKLDEKEKQIINEILDISEYSEIGENGVKATKYDIKKRLNRLTFVLTNACNLRCEYCYEDGNGETKFDYLNNEKMDFNIAKYYINTLFEVYDSVDTVMFFGGEPALELDMMEEICDYIDSLYI